MVLVKNLKENVRNPRFIKDERFKALAKSLEEFPRMMGLRPIIIEDDGTILGGNMRFRALKELGYKELPDEWVKKASDLTDEEKDRFLIEDNVSFGDWDLDKIKQGWNAELLKGWGVELQLKEDLKKPDTEYDNSNCEYPLIPMYDEKYTAFIIVCETDTEEAAIRTMFNFPLKAQSYKNSFLGRSNVLTAKEILNDTSRNFIPQEVEQCVDEECDSELQVVHTGSAGEGVQDAQS